MVRVRNFFPHAFSKFNCNSTLDIIGHRPLESNGIRDQWVPKPRLDPEQFVLMNAIQVFQTLLIILLPLVAVVGGLILVYLTRKELHTKCEIQPDEIVRDLEQAFLKGQLNRDEFQKVLGSANHQKNSGVPIDEFPGHHNSDFLEKTSIDPPKSPGS